MKLLYALFLTIGLFTMPAYASVSSYTDISYGALPEQKLDIYLPQSSHKNAIVFVYVHGGAWRLGNKSQVHSKATATTKQGMVFVSIEYPMLPDHGVGQQAQSVAKAIAWIYKNIPDYGGNPNTVFISGHSAGAHLVSLIATDSKYLKKYGLSPAVIKGVIAIDSAAINIPWRMKNLNNDPRLVQKMFYDAFGRRPSNWSEFSPHDHIGRATTPPFLLFRASDRQNTKPAYNMFTNAIRKHGGSAQTIEIPNTTHRSINEGIGTKNNETFQHILDFIAKYS